MRRFTMVVSLAAMMAMVAMVLGAMPGQAARLSGTVTLNNRLASAVVIAVPYNPVTHVTIEGQARIMPTDAQGVFAMEVPDGNFLLVAWDGRNGAVVNSPVGSIALQLTEQGPPKFMVAADCSYKCSCSHIIGNLYWVNMWGNGVFCGSYQYLSWGCKC